MEIRHNNFYRFRAKNNFELGFLMGQKFASEARGALTEMSTKNDWSDKTKRAERCLKVTQKYFPQYIEELTGYAKGADMDFLNLWTLSLEDEVDKETSDKCTTVVTNNGTLISHNEDWDEDSENSVCVVLKTVGQTRMFELFYYNTLGANSVSVNSHGILTALNTLYNSDAKVGVPRNVIARFAAETDNPEQAIRILKEIPRGAAYNITQVNASGKIWNIEYTSTRVVATTPQSPFVHTNHYLAPELVLFEANDDSGGTRLRYRVACARVKPQMNVAEIIDLTNDDSEGDERSIMNKRTIGKMVVDMKNLTAKVWLKREAEKGWVEYNLRELLGL